MKKKLKKAMSEVMSTDGIDTIEGADRAIRKVASKFRLGFDELKDALIGDSIRCEVEAEERVAPKP